MMKKLLAFALGVAVVASLVTGCKPPPPPPAGPKLDFSKIDYSKDFVVTVKNSVEANIYLDATESMAGYVKPQGTTAYIEAVKGIDTVIKGIWASDKIEYFKFGNRRNFIEKITSSQFKDANVGFYREELTAEDKVVEKLDMKKLNIIVTDLFQTDQHLESLTAALKRKCFTDQTAALGIIGLKSEFKGMIYDIGREQKSISYESKNGNEETYRPFYLIVTGNADDVRIFMLRYKAKFSNAEFVLFSKNMAGKSILKSVSGEDLKKDTVPMQRLEAKGDKLVFEYKIQKDAKKGYQEIAVYSGNCITSVDKYTVSYKNEKFFTGNTVLSKQEGPLVGNLLEFYVSPIGIEYKKGEYPVKFNLIADKPSYISACKEVFDKWNIDENTAVKNLKAVGNKTLNINKLITDLSEYSYRFMEPGLYDIELIIQAK